MPRKSRATTALEEPSPGDVIAFEQSHAFEVGGDIEEAVAEEAMPIDDDHTPGVLTDENATIHGKPVETPVTEVLPDPEPHEIERAEGEGMVDVPAPVVATKSTYEQILEAEWADAIERAIVEVCDAELVAEKKKSAAIVKKEEASDARKAWESADDDLRDAAQRLRRLREGREPDPDKHPLFDKPKDARDVAKAEIDATFPAPVAIQPTPADTIDEFFRRKRRDTRLDSLGLTAKVDEILAAAGYVTILDLDKLFEASADLCTINVAGTGSITEKRQESILNAIAELAAKWKAEWDAEHPSAEAETVPEPAEEKAGVIVDPVILQPTEVLTDPASESDTAEFEPVTEEGGSNA